MHQKIKKEYVAPKALEAVNSISALFSNAVKSKPEKSNKIPNFNAITGSLYEAGLARVVGGGLSDDADDNRVFDFPAGLRDAAGVFGADGKALQNIKTDAKVTSSSSALKSIRAKVKNDLSKNKFAKGGAAPSDTVPALLTPGEFVFNESAAKSIGYDNLKRMNEQGVQGYAAGGVVSSGRSLYGNGTPAGSNDYAASLIKQAEDEANARKENTETIEKNTKQEETRTGKQKKLSSVLDGVKTKIKVFKDSISTSAEKVQRMASSAQSFVFLGASVGAVTSQMSGLEDSTKKAINETAAFATGIVGIGATVIDTLANMVISQTVQEASSRAVTEAQIEQAASSKAVTASNAGAGKLSSFAGKAGKALAGFGLGLLVGVSTLKFFSAKNRAIADEMQAKINTALDKVKQGAGANAEDLKKICKG